MKALCEGQNEMGQQIARPEDFKDYVSLLQRKSP